MNLVYRTAPVLSVSRTAIRSNMVRSEIRSAIQPGHVAVIGARRGIGLEFTKQLLARGHHVFATVRSPKQAEELQKMQHSGAELTLGELDTTEPESIQAWVDTVRGQASQLQAVFNVAGAASWHSLDEVDSEELLRLFSTNAVGPLIVVQRLLRAGLLSKGTYIINLTSKMGSMGDNTSGGTYAYRASKAAINAITKSMAIDLQSRGITACTLHPGWVRTDMTRGSGLIDANESVAGLLSVIDEEATDLSGRLFDYKHEEIPW